MDGPFYHDMIEPWQVADSGALALTTSPQIILPSQNLPNYGNNYFNYRGKHVRIRASGEMTSGATPGNFQFNWFYGSGASNTGVSLCSVAVTWGANTTGQAWTAELDIVCASYGTSGGLVCGGWIYWNVIGVVMCPPGNIGTSVVNTTTNPQYITLQASRTGSTAETITMHDIMYEALN